MATYAPLWTGPALLVPITVDALLVGTPNQVAGALWAQTGINYGGLSQVNPGVTPFAQKTPPPVGAHLLWSLPFAVRHGTQATKGEQAGTVRFPLVPNRWAILRSYVPSSGGQPGTAAPQLTAGILSSDALHSLGASDSPYPQSNPTNVVGIGQYVSLQQWDGSAGAAPFLQAAGPGDVSWSAAYDNIKNVFAFHDDLSSQPVGFYTYSVVGWYSDPTVDPLTAWTEVADWVPLMEQLEWGVGQDQDHALPAATVVAAQAAWTAWQTAHGLTANTFNSAKVDPALVPGQLGALMNKWGAYQTANGSSSVPAAQLTLPAQTLCHGAVLKVPWQGANYGYPSGAPRPDIGQGSVSVAVGNTPGEALAAWMANWINGNSPGSPVDELETVLEAFQKGLVFDLGTRPTETAAALHQARFDGQKGGTHWIVVRPEQSHSDETGERNLQTGAGGNPGMPLNEAQTTALRLLNATQAALDKANDEVAQLQWELWALYYKLWYIGIPPAIDTSAVQAAIVTLVGADAVNSDGSIAGLLGAARQAVAQGTASSQAALAALQALLVTETETADFVIKQINNVNFSSPADPVVLIAGAHADTKNAPPSAYGGDNFLFTRFTGQTLSAITISQPQAPTNPVTLSAADLEPALQIPGASGAPASLGIPKELADLWLETLLADQSASGWLAQLYLNKYRTQYGTASPLTAAQAQSLIALQQSALWNDVGQLGVTREALAAAAQFTGVPPSVIALEDGTNQPWSPLYLDWEVEWHPSPLNEQGFPRDWQLQGLDYQWQGTTIPTNATIYQGRTTINPLISQTLTQQLAGFVESDPDYASLPLGIRTDLQSIQEGIKQFDFITQSLSGFTEQLITRLATPSQTVPAAYFGDKTAAQVNDIVQGSQTVQPVVATGAGGPPDYWPLRAGHFRITNLWVVDAYGQVLTPRATHADCVYFDAASPVQTAENSTEYAQLPPRFTQSARLNLTMIQADNDALPSNSADATSPVCGWVIPQHLDDSLLVYDAAGNSLGSVLAIRKDAGQTGLRWESAPGSDAPLGSVPQFANAHLQGFVTALLQQGESGTDAFRALLDTIDAASWQIQPHGQNAQSNLAVLAGNPIAVVRARINIDLYGDPILAFDEDLTQTGTVYPPNPPPAFSTAPVSVRIGDDSFATNGVAGYFVGDNYNQFHAVGANPGITSKLRRSLTSSEDFRSALSELAHGEVTASANPYVIASQALSLAPKTVVDSRYVDTSIHVTLLMHPSARVPVVAGAFPVQYGDLPVGPVSAALRNMSLSFRIGPVLLDPAQIKMPLPADIHGKWSWMERQSVSQWDTTQDIKQPTVTNLPTTPPRLREGWLLLGEAEAKT